MSFCGKKKCIINAMSRRSGGTVARIVPACLCFGLYGADCFSKLPMPLANRRFCRQIAILLRPSRAPPPAGRPSESAGPPSESAEPISQPNLFGSGKNVIRSSSPKEGKNNLATVRSGSEMMGSAVGWQASGRPGYPLLIRQGPNRARHVRLFSSPL